MSRRSTALVLVLLATIWVGGCSGDTPETGSAEQPSDSKEVQLPPSRTLSIPGQGSPGTPPSTGMSPHGAGASPHDRGMFWKVPDDWIKEEPASSMRIAQYRIPSSAGDAGCIVFYFGPGMGGDAQSNATRWARQFEQPDGRDSTELMKVSELDGAQRPVLIVEVTGTYDGGMAMSGAPEKKPGYMLLGGIAEGPDAPWFFKFTGPKSTIEAQRAAFLEMMRSVGGNG